MKIGVVGCGNVGLNTLKAFHLKGNEVLGFDVDAAATRRIEYELGPSVAVKSFAELRHAEIIFVCVPTDPRERDGAADLSVIDSVVDSIAELERASDYGCRVVVQRSTCPPGTGNKLSERLKRTGYAVNPSFLRKATQWEDTIRPERIAIGGSTDVLRLLVTLYEPFPGPRLLLESLTAVELLKYFENCLDASLISLWNEFLQIADASGLSREDFAQVFDAMADRHKFRTTQRVPGKAFGMWCLPKDLSAIVAAFPTLDLPTLKGVRATNDSVRTSRGENDLSGGVLLDAKDSGYRLSRSGLELLMTATLPEMRTLPPEPAASGNV